MSTISGWNFSQNITLADNCKQKNEDLDTWYVGMNDFARIAGGQNSRSNILSPRAFLEFLAKIFTLGYVDFSKRSNEAGRNMMAHIKGRCEQVPDMRSSYSSGAHPRGTS